MSQSAKDQEDRYRREPRRRFSAEYKCRMVQTLLSSTMSLARFAREHDLNHNQLARWRREYEQGTYGPMAQAGVEFVPACVGPIGSSSSQVASCTGAIATVELHLAKGRIVMHDVGVDCLRALVEALR
ncbi:IS66 family insertion sequence element accessory protein TnpA [Cupriavidus sp. 30B13]|uniref:IS66 family insertion sequence element accessory protein TnpA n=1 Tax=Cupriavidus sp. 30B13 TaxID=3384241 RepID=UPI003B8F4C5C